MEVNLKDYFKIDDSHSKIRGFLVVQDEQGKIILKKENMIVNSGRELILKRLTGTEDFDLRNLTMLLSSNNDLTESSDTYDTYNGSTIYLPKKNGKPEFKEDGFWYIGDRKFENLVDSSFESAVNENKQWVIGTNTGVTVTKDNTPEFKEENGCWYIGNVEFKDLVDSSFEPAVNKNKQWVIGTNTGETAYRKNPIIDENLTITFVWNYTAKSDTNISSLMLVHNYDYDYDYDKQPNSILFSRVVFDEYKLTSNTTITFTYTIYF